MKLNLTPMLQEPRGTRASALGRQFAAGCLAILGLPAMLLHAGDAPPAVSNQPTDIITASPPLKLLVKPRSWEIEIRHNDQSLLLYTMGRKQFKPYVKELRTLKGDNLLLDSPPDHVHHHGLMYAITVNGINFWEEQKDPGVELPTSTPVRWAGKTADGRPMVMFSHVVLWIPDAARTNRNAGAQALLTEIRSLALTVDEATQEVAVRWHADFEVGPGAEQVKLTGAAYHGLGMRLIHPFDLKARHFNSAEKPYSAEQKWDVIAAKWSAIEHQLDGRDVMAAIFAGPKNAGESDFFTMLNAFAYVSATQNLDKAPIEYKRGDKFSLDYLVLTYSERKSREFLDQRYARWVDEPLPATPQFPSTAK